MSEIKKKYREYANIPSADDVPFDFVTEMGGELIQKRREWVNKMEERFCDFVSNKWIRKNRKEGDSLITTDVSWTKDVNGICGFMYGSNINVPISAYFVSLFGNPMETEDFINPGTFETEKKDAIKINIGWCKIGEGSIKGNIYTFPFECFEMTREQYDTKFGYFDSFEFAMEIVK